MHRVAVVIISIMLLSTGVFAGEAPDPDTSAIKKTVLNYLEGWFSSDAGRMQAALHPNLFKCTVRTIPNTEIEILDTVGAETMVSYTAHNQEWVKGKQFHEMKIVYQDDRIAVVHAVSDGFYDVCSLVKINGEWKILQVLWANSPSPEQ